MEKDFHFYVTYALANTSGFTPEESHIIAYASQYVDDNNEKQYPEKDEKPAISFTNSNKWWSFPPHYDPNHIRKIFGI